MASGRGKSSLATDLKSYLDSLTSWKHSGTAKPRSNQRKKINLALQGGGAHGAFTWGVLDQLLDDGRLAIEGISGASAGAVNAVMLADGLARGGPEEAKKRLPPVLGAAAPRGASAPPCRRCSAPWSNGSFPSCRSRARRSRPGSMRCRAICRPTTST